MFCDDVLTVSCDKICVTKTEKGEKKESKKIEEKRRVTVLLLFSLILSFSM